MKFENVSIVGLAALDAPCVVTSTELEERMAPALARVGMQKGLIKSLTGILERRFWDEGVTPSEVAARAGALALQDAGIDASQVGVLISTSVSKDYIEPSVASLVHGALEMAPQCLNFDVGNACLGLLNGIQIAGDMIERGQIEYALIVDGEDSRFVVERTIERLLDPSTDIDTFRNQFATFTLGSGAAAVVLGRSDQAPQGHRVMGGVALAASKYNHLCRGQRESMETDAAMLLVAGLELAEQTFELAQDELGWHPDVLDEVVIHQVSAVHTAKFADRLSIDTSKIYKIFPHFGNVGPASIPIVLSKAREAGRLGRGARVALMGIGSGLNCSMMEVIW